MTTARRLTYLAGPLVAALIASACGSSATPSPAAPDGKSPAPSAAATAASTPGDGQSPDGGASQPPDGGSFDFGDAATNLDSLDSYRFSVEIQSSSTTTSGVEAGTTAFSGIVNRKDGAQTLEMVSKDETGSVTDQTSVVITADGAWMKSLGDDTWLQLPAEQASLFAQSFSAFRPEQLFSLYFAAAATDNTLVGMEQKNGIETNHYRGSDAIGAILSGMTGVNGSWQSDVWIAKDGGYLVHSEAGASGGDASGGGSFAVVVDITDVNSSSNSISPPQ
jgi:hypothetical protein